MVELINVIDGEGSVIYEVSTETHETYTGPYTVTPSDETQTLETADKIMSHNVTINPIPSNYGLITWNGSVLTVS